MSKSIIYTTTSYCKEYYYFRDFNNMNEDKKQNESHGSYITDIIILLFLTGLTLLSIFNPLRNNTFLKQILGIVFIAFLPGI